MNFNACEIYRRTKNIGVLPCKFIKKTEFCEEHILLSDTYVIKPGYILLINGREKFYVTDIRLHHPNEHKLEIYYETAASHKIKITANRKVNLSLLIAFLALIVSIIALFKK